MARKMQITLKSAAQSQQEQCCDQKPSHPLAADARGEREISHLPCFKGERRRGWWALGPNCLAEELTAVGFFYWKGWLLEFLICRLVDAAEHLKNSGLKLGMAEGNNLELLTVLGECVSELTLRTDLGGKVKKKVGWKGQKLLRGKEDKKPELTWGKHGTLSLLKYFKRSGLNKSTLFSRSTSTLKQMTIMVFFPVTH